VAKLDPAQPDAVITYNIADMFSSNDTDCPALAYKLKTSAWTKLLTNSWNVNNNPGGTNYGLNADGVTLETQANDPDTAETFKIAARTVSGKLLGREVLTSFCELAD